MPTPSFITKYLRIIIAATCAALLTYAAYSLVKTLI